MKFTFNITTLNQKVNQSLIHQIILIVVFFLWTLPIAISQFGPNPSAARLYNNGAETNSSQTACTPSADVDNGTMNFISSVPAAGQAAACYTAGQSTQWIQFSTPVGVNQIKFQLVSNKVTDYAVYWTTQGLNSASTVSDLNYLGCKSTLPENGGFETVTNLNIPANKIGYYYVAFHYVAGNGGNFLFKTKECETVPAYTCIATDGTSFENCLQHTVTQTIETGNTFNVANPVDLTDIIVDLGTYIITYTNPNVCVNKNTQFADNGGSIVTSTGQTAGPGSSITIAQLNAALAALAPAPGTCITLESVMSSILPIELGAFKASLEKDRILLNWYTISETNNAYFELEYSADGKKFNHLDKVNGAGTTTERQAYQYAHFDFAKTTNYYRLKQVDEDGAFSYSEVVVVTIPSDEPIQIYPTLVDDQLHYVLKESVSSAAVLRVLDHHGRLLHQQAVNRDAKEGNIDVASLARGQYFLQVLTKEEVYTARFLKL